MPEEGFKVHRFAAVLPEQHLTEASRHRDAVVPTDQRAVMRCLGDDLAGLVHDVSHSRKPCQDRLLSFADQFAAFNVCSYTRNGGQPVKLGSGGCALLSTTYGHAPEPIHRRH